MSQYKALLEKQNKEKQEKEAKEKQEKQKSEEAKRKKNEAKQKQEAKPKVEEYPTYDSTYEHSNEKKPDRGGYRFVIWLLFLTLVCLCDLVSCYYSFFIKFFLNVNCLLFKEIGVFYISK